MPNSEPNHASSSTPLRRFTIAGLVITVLGFGLAYQFVEPSPPSSITVASGSKTGAYYHYAKQYAKILARDNITVNILNTQGSVENIDLLKTKKVDVAFVQGGVGDGAREPNLRSLGSLYFEPLWLFVQKGSPLVDLNDLHGQNIAVGSIGSGTWAITQKLLSLNKVDTLNASIQHLSSAKAAEALLNGSIEAAFFVTSPASPLIKKLLLAKNLELVNFDRAEAYVRRLPYLSPVTLPRGVFDLSLDVPAKNFTLLAPAATLATGPDLHPALQTLLVQAAMEIHAGGGIFEGTGQFPSANFVDYPLSDDAQRYFKDGPPFLQRYLPFWGAVLVDQLKVMLVPLITLLFPLFKILPPAYRWRIRSRIYRMYTALADIEQKASLDPEQAALLLTRLEDEVAHLKVPLSYADELYNLRLHVDMIKRRLIEKPPTS